MDTECILVTKSISSSGYGTVWFEKRRQQAHRVAWIKAYGPIPQGLHVLHKCDVKACVNPEHLFLGTHKDNMHDMKVKGRARSPNSDKTHCPKGHEYTEDNVYRDPQGWRKCRTCTLKRMKVKYEATMATSSRCN